MESNAKAGAGAAGQIPNRHRADGPACATVERPAADFHDSRPIGRTVLLARAQKLRDQAFLLERLAAAIPDHFPEDASDGLASLVYNQRI